jgi:anti-sigma factor RsiW
MMIEEEVCMTNRVKWETPPVPESSGLAPIHEDADELEALMSLALDGMLNEADSDQLERLLMADAGWSAEWQNWQAMDAALRSAPAFDPPADFLADVDRKIVQWERRRRFRSGVIIGLAAMLLWGSALVGLFSLGAFVLANQATWLSELIQGIAYGWVRVVSTAQLVWSTVVGLATTPQAAALGICYGLAAAVLLALWIGFLRKTTRVGEQLSA